MTYYDHSDPNRTSGGQFTNLNIANTGEQMFAGVNHGDSLDTAYYKVQNDRIARGVDPFTGLAPPPTFVGGYSGYSGGSRVSVDPNAHLEGQVWKGLFKALIFWPAMIAIALATLVGGATFAGRIIDAPTLAQEANNEISGHKPAPLAAFFSAKALASPINPASFAAAARAFHPGQGKQHQARLHAIQGQAYRCMRQEGCRVEVDRMDPSIGRQLPFAAADFLADLAKNGDEDATRELCYFGLKSGVSYKDLMGARRNCERANQANPNSVAGAQAMAALDQSWAMRRARWYATADELQYRWTH